MQKSHKTKIVKNGMDYDVVEAVCLKGYDIRVRFADGLEGIVNLEELVGCGEAFGPLKNLDYFCKVRIDEHGQTLAWPNGADICPELLYRIVKNAPNHYATLGPN